MTMEKRKVPNTALQLREPTEILLSEKDDENGEKKRTASMVALSGEVIKDHWWWGTLYIDMTGLLFDSNPLPILEDHRTDKKIGMVYDPAKGVDKKNSQLIFAEIQLLENDDANTFYDNSKQGFPYQASVRVKPSKIEHLEEEATAEVNGMTVEGPATIFRQTTIKESSVCVFGWDSQTESAALSEASEDVILSLNEIGKPATRQLKDAFVAVGNANAGEKTILTQEDNIMNKAELLAKHPELKDMFKEEADEAKKAVDADHQTELSEKDGQIDTLTQENEKLSKTNEESQDRIGNLEKKDTIRTEKELKMTADTIINTHLSKSNIPPRLHEKVLTSLDHNKFVENDILDTEKFTELVVSEVTEWNEAFKDSPKPKNTIRGMSFSSDDEQQEAENKLTEDNDATVERMLGYSGKKKVAGNAA